MSEFEDFLERAAADPLSYAREHARSGGRVIGMVGIDVPVELIAAADAMPLSLPAFAGGPTPLADRYFEPSFMPAIRSIADQWLQGQFDFLDAVIFSRANDSAQRCYYYLCELQRRGLSAGPKPLVFDVAKIPRDSSVAHTERLTNELAREIGSDPERLAEAVSLRDRRRDLLSRLHSLRRSERAPSGAACQRALRLSDMVPAAEFDPRLERWLDHMQPVRRAPRLLLGGTAPPDERLHSAVDRAGGCIVAELGEHAMDRLGPLIGPTSNPIPTIARHYHVLEHGARSFVDPAALLARRVADFHLDGAILWLIEEDEALPWQLPGMTATLESLGIPALVLTRKSWHAEEDTLRQIAAFTRELGVES